MHPNSKRNWMGFSRFNAIVSTEFQFPKGCQLTELFFQTTTTAFGYSLQVTDNLQTNKEWKVKKKIQIGIKPGTSGSVGVGSITEPLTWPCTQKGEQYTSTEYPEGNAGVIFKSLSFKDELNNNTTCLFKNNRKQTILHKILLLFCISIVKNHHLSPIQIHMSHKLTHFLWKHSYLLKPFSHVDLCT